MFAFALFLFCLRLLFFVSLIGWAFCLCLCVCVCVFCLEGGGLLGSFVYLFGGFVVVVLFCFERERGREGGRERGKEGGREKERERGGARGWGGGVGDEIALLYLMFFLIYIIISVFLFALLPIYFFESQVQAIYLSNKILIMMMMILL